MRKVTVVKGQDVEVKAFVLGDFIAKEEISKQETPSTVKALSKKELKVLAKELGLKYDEKNIAFAKKLLNAHIKKNI